MKRLSVLMLGAALALVLVGCATDETTTTAAPGTTATTEATTTTAAPDTTVTTEAAMYTADLSGDQVNPPNDSTAGGQATFTPSSDGSSMDFELSVEELADVAAAHIHMGAAGEDGGVIVPLFNGPAKTGPFTGILAEGTLTEADLAGDLQGMTIGDLIDVIEAGDAYVNVHTAAFPGGEIRGQVE